jgi:hypothetical protein
MLKRISFILICFVLSDLLLFGQEQTGSKIIVYRESNFAESAISYKVFINKEMVVKLRNGSYYQF